MDIYKQRWETFAREYVISNDAAFAYRKAYPRSFTPDSPKAAGWRLVHRKPWVANRIRELREEIMKKSDITIERILTDYERAKQMAIEQEKPADLVNAATAQAKLVGLLKDRVEQTNINFDTMDDPSEIIAAVAKEAGDEVASALAKALGIIPADEPNVEALEASKPPTDAVN